MTRAVVIGQSHCNAIAQALGAGDHGTDPGIRVFRVGGPDFGPDGEPFTFGAGISMVATLPAGTPIFLSVLGGYHNVLGLFESGPRFDFLLDSQDVAEPPPTVRVPNRAIAGVLEDVFRGARKIQRLRGASKAPVYMLSIPPPKRSNEFVMSRVIAQRKKVDAGASVPEIGVERPEIRLKFWRLEARLLASWAERERMHFIPPPAEACDEDGFLGERFYDDATHANAQYGALVVKQIEAIIAGEEAHD